MTRSHADRPDWARRALVALVLASFAIAPGPFARPARAEPAEISAPLSNVVYVTTNNPTLGMNAVLAFTRGVACGLTLLGSFPTGGTGVGNPNFRLGTLESDQNLIVSPDQRFLFAVNSGSDSIAAFAIQPGGALVAVAGSPFSSGGHMPATLGYLTDTHGGSKDKDKAKDKDSDILIVAHKNEVPGEVPTAFPPPNYTAFSVAADGRLTPIAGSTIVLPQGSSPTQTLVSNDGRFLFSTELLVDFPTDFFPTDGFPWAPGAGGGSTLRSFKTGPKGLHARSAIRLPGPDSNHPDPLGLLSGSMHISGTTNGGLGVAVHPTQPILYVAYPFRFQIGVYTWDAGGDLTFSGVVNNSGQVVSHLQVSADGLFLYSTNKLDSTVSGYSLADPLEPVEIVFRDLRLAPGATQGGLTAQASATPDGQCFYVLEQRITDAAGDGSANALHVMVAPALLETPAPINLEALGVPRTARPQGVVAF